MLIFYPEPIMFVYCFFAMLIWYHLTVVLSNVSKMAQQMESIKEDLHKLKSSVGVSYISDSELENYDVEISEIGIKTPEIADFDTPETKEDIEKWLKGE